MPTAAPGLWQNDNSMIIASLAFTCGCLLCQLLAALPDHSIVLLLPLPAFALLLASLAWPRLLPLAMFAAGFAWSLVLAAQRMDARLAPELEGRDVEAAGCIATMPSINERGVRFDFRIDRSAAALPPLVALNWYRGRRPEVDDDWHQAPQVRAGDCWRLRLRLRRPHGLVNPHVPDGDLAWLERGIGAVGYVRPSAGNRRLPMQSIAPGLLVERWRQALRERYQAALGEASYGGILIALAIGDQRAIDNRSWLVFARTGVTHLLSVSGLHVTMLAGLAATLTAWGWRRSALLPLRLPAQKAGMAAGLLAAFAYCLIAGFAVPAQRTLYMLAVVTAALWTGRSSAVGSVLATALLLVLVLDPWAVISASFWLSFGAVSLLFYVGTSRPGRGHWLAGWLRAQWAVTLGMVPVLLALFQEFSLVSPLANAVAIPVVSLLVTPLALLGCLPQAAPLLSLADAILEPLMVLLRFLAESKSAVWEQAAPDGWVVAAGLLGALWLLMPRGVPARSVGVVLLVPLFLVAPERPGPGEARVAVLDVGQGLAVHVQTGSHDLLYDAGPAWGTDADAGNRILLPYLRGSGVQHLDVLMVSHSDRDHEGGARSVLEAVQVDELLSSLPDGHALEEIPVRRRRCQQGQAWTWDGVAFEVLHPLAADYQPGRSNNALSCVLRLAAPGGTLLLTGDIGAAEEGAMLNRHVRLAADVVVPAHHGSAGSSTADFVAAVGARSALFSAGYRNRFGHPAPAVVGRYVDLGAEIRRTDREGALRVSIGPEGLVVSGERQRRQRYWRAD